MMYGHLIKVKVLQVTNNNGLRLQFSWKYNNTKTKVVPYNYAMNLPDQIEDILNENGLNIIAEAYNEICYLVKPNDFNNLLNFFNVVEPSVCK